MAYRVDTVTAGETLPDIAGATLLGEALQSFARLVVTGAYDRVLVRDTNAGTVVAEWRKQGFLHGHPQSAAEGEAARAAATYH